MKKENDITFGEFGIKHLGDIKKLIHTTIETNWKQIYTKSQVNEINDLYTDHCIIEDATTGVTLLAFINNELVGIGTVIGDYIRSIFILPKYQGKGIGKTLIENLEKIAISKKYKSIKLETIKSTEQYFKNLGYEIDTNIDSDIEILCRMIKKL